MDVTCGILFSTDSSTMAQLECALLASNYDEIEKYAKKLKKKREISHGLEIILDCYVNIHRQVRLHAASLELDLTHLLAYQVKSEISNSIKEKLKKVLMMDMDSNSSESELKLAYVLLGILGLFCFDGGKESLKDSLAYFDKIDFDLSKKFLLYEQGDTEITQSTLIEKIFGILGLFFRGLALELSGHKEEASDQYQVINDFLIRFRVQQFTQSKSVHDFICSALYRSGCLLNQLAQFKESAAIFRSFLNFYQVSPQTQLRQPSNSTIRLLRTLSQYMDLLDRKFRTFNFKTFCDEYSSTYNTRNNASTWQADNVQEELILCSMLLLTIPQSKLVRQTLEDLRLESSVLKRFARIGYLEGITRIQKTHFQSKTGSIEIYRNLFHSLMSADKKDLAILSAKMYLQGNGRDPFTLLLIAKLYLSLPTKLAEAWEILETKLDDCEKLDIGMQIPYFLLRGQYHLLKSRMECPFTSASAKELLTRAEAEFRLALQVDETNADAYFYLSLISYENFDLDQSERHVKKSLSLDSSQTRSWNLFALLKSAKKEYESVLNICNTELSNMIQKDHNLSLLKVSALLPLNRSDEAIETLKKIISAHFRKSNDFKMDGGMTVISEGTLGPGNFLSKFLGDLNGSIYDFETVAGGSINTSNSGGGGGSNSQYNGKLDIFMGLGKGTTFSGYTESFPKSLEEYLISTLTPDATDHPLIAKSIPLKDLAAIRGNDNFTITSLWVEVARVYLHEGHLQDAEAALNQAFLGNEVFAPIFGTFGLIDESRVKKGDKNNRSDKITDLNDPAPEEFYRKGLSINDQDETCLLGLSRVLVRSNDPSKLFESECHIRKLIQKDPSNPEAWSILAQCCSGTGRIAEAMGYFDSALKKEIISPLRSIRSIQ